MPFLDAYRANPDDLITRIRGAAEEEVVADAARRVVVFGSEAAARNAFAANPRNAQRRLREGQRGGVRRTKKTVKRVKKYIKSSKSRKHSRK